MLKEKIKITFCLLLEKHLLILKIGSKAASHFCSGFLFKLVEFFQCWSASESQSAIRTSFRVTGGYQKAGTSFLKRVAGRIFSVSRLVSDFIEASGNFI